MLARQKENKLIKGKAKSFGIEYFQEDESNDARFYNENEEEIR